MYDVIVIGARPAGLAATYALHHHLNTLEGGDAPCLSVFWLPPTDRR